MNKSNFEHLSTEEENLATSLGSHATRLKKKAAAYG